MKRISTMFGLVALVLLVGSGCASTTSENKNNPAVKEGTPVAVSPQKNAEPRGGNTMKQSDTSVTSLVLQGQAIGNRSARFQWDVPEDIEAQVETYIVVRDTEKNPTYPEARWWWWRGPVYRALEWSELPLGSAHFRLCAQVGEECIAYSNDLVLEIE